MTLWQNGEVYTMHIIINTVITITITTINIITIIIINFIIIIIPQIQNTHTAVEATL